MKRFFPLLLASALLCMTLAACTAANNEEGALPTPPPSTPAATVTETPAATVTETPAATVAETPQASDGESGNAGLPATSKVDITFEGVTKTYPTTLAVSSRFGYAVYLLDQFEFLEVDGSDLIQPKQDATDLAQIILQIYAVDSSRPVPADERTDEMCTYYKHFTVGNTVLEVQFNYPNEIVAGDVVLLDAMANSIVSATTSH